MNQITKKILLDLNREIETGLDREFYAISKVLDWDSRQNWCRPIDIIKYDNQDCLIELVGIVLRISNTDKGIQLLQISGSGWEFTYQGKPLELNMLRYYNLYLFYYQDQWWLLHTDTNETGIIVDYVKNNDQSDYRFWWGDSVNISDISRLRFNRNLDEIISTEENNKNGQNYPSYL